MKTKINPSDVRRHGNTILLGQGRTATENYNENLPRLRIRQRGRIIKTFRGSSLGFCRPLTDEDRSYLASLGSDD